LCNEFVGVDQMIEVQARRSAQVLLVDAQLLRGTIKLRLTCAESQAERAPSRSRRALTGIRAERMTGIAAMLRNVVDRPVES
jgi:hypothetical protein